MTYHQALALQHRARPLWRKAGRALVDLCLALLVAGLIVIPGALIDIIQHAG